MFDWDVAGDKIFVSPEVEQLLGLKRGALEGPASDWLELIHPFDRDRYRAALDAVIEQRRGRIVQDFRLRAANGPYHWFRLKARPVVGSDGEVIRVVGTLSDVTDAKTAEERLLHDAVHDNLTGLPNRELFNDRLDAALTYAKQDEALKPTALVIDIDRFKQINESVGFSAGDSILLTLSRRLGRLLRPQDTLARIAGDEFAMILLSESEPDRIIGFAEMIRRAVTTPITYAEREIFLTASVGLVLHDPQTAMRRDDVVKNAEIAMAHAKRQGGDRIRGFPPGHALRPRRPADAGKRPAARPRPGRDQGACSSRSSGWRTAPSPGSRRCCAGITRVSAGSRPQSFIPLAEETGLIVNLGVFALERAALRVRRLAARARRRSADLRQRQRVEPPAPAPRPPARREDRAGAHATCCRARSSSN